MRLLFISLMVVLLPLRGWAGNVMAVDMAATTVVQATMANANSKTAMSADCAMDMQSSSDTAVPHCSNCDTCELCVAVANLTHEFWPANRLTQHCSPPAFDVSFTSAVRSPNRKPPIS